jgi:hypothetical protein
MAICIDITMQYVILFGGLWLALCLVAKVAKTRGEGCFGEDSSN